MPATNPQTPPSPPAPAEPEPAPRKAADRSGGLEPGHQIALVGLLVTIFLAIGYWLHSDIQEARQALRDLEGKAAAAEVKRTQLEGELKEQDRRIEEQRRAVDLWSARAFAEICGAMKGTYHSDLKTCDSLADGRSLKYEPPFP